MKLSICIPTFNRARYLKNCLNSIISSGISSGINFEICISDNYSTDETELVVKEAGEKIAIRYHKNHVNLGIPRNFLNVVSMATGEFVWLIGDDDLLLPNSIYEIHKLFYRNPEVDFFYVNSYHLTADYLNGYPSPFDIINLPTDMERFSKYKKDGVTRFLDLIDPNISFDFLGGMYLSVFKRELWIKNTDALDKNAIIDTRTFSTLDNTFPHIKIFAKGFSKSHAYFNAAPLIVCLSGVREWTSMSPLVMSVRLVEALEQYRKFGLPLLQYLYCRNYALKNFLPDLIKMFLYKNISGYIYIQPKKLLIKNFIYPNLYLSNFYYLLRKFRLAYKSLSIFKSIKAPNERM